MTTKLATLAAGLFALVAMLDAHTAHAAIRTQSFDYKDGNTVLEGFIAWDDARTGKLPGVVVYPQWTGPTDFERDEAKKLAQLGYVAMVADVYGKGIHPTAPKEAGAMMGKSLADRPSFRVRVRAALDRLLQNPHVDATRMAAIGFCFGGASALELGRQGADVKALVTFHGELSNPTPADAKNIKGHVLVLHGTDDPAVPPEEVAAFRKEMKDAGTDFTFVSYSGTKHGFMMPSSGTDESKFSFYNPVSARRAWQAMKDFLAETLGK